MEKQSQPKKRVSPFDAPLKAAAKEVNATDGLSAADKKAQATRIALGKAPSPKAAEKKTATKAPASKPAEKKVATKPAEKKTTTKTATKAPAKKAAPKATEKKVETKKAATTKKPATKTTTKKAAPKKPAKPKIDESKITSVKIDPRTGTIRQSKPKVEPKPVEEKPAQPKKVAKPKVKKPTIKSKDVTIEPAPRDNTPKEIVRPTPKKVKQYTKEEKVLYKALEDAFNTVGNMTTVIEERTLDKSVNDLTIGELHVIEMVNKYNNKPMTLIAKKLHVTVGSLTIGVNRLVQKGYLLRIRDEMDRRVILLSITQQGKKILKYHDKFHEDILGLVLDTIPLQQAVKVMSQFAHILEVYYDPSLLEVQETKTIKKGR